MNKFNVGDIVWAKDPIKRYMCHAGKVTSVAGNNVVVKKNNGGSQTFPRQDVSKDLEELLPNPYKTGEDMAESVRHSVGDTVTPKIGPHKGTPHRVIHVGDDGLITIAPKNLKADKIRYRLGAVKAKQSDLEESSADDSLIHNEESLDELDQSTIKSYTDKAKEELRQAKKYKGYKKWSHAEYADIAQRVIDRRTKGLAMAKTRNEEVVGEAKIDFAKKIQKGINKTNKAVVSTRKEIGYRIADVGAGGKEYNVKTNKAWDDAKKNEDVLDESYWASGTINSAGKESKWKVKYGDFPTKQDIQKQNSHLNSNQVDAIYSHIDSHSDDDMTGTSSVYKSSGGYPGSTPVPMKIGSTTTHKVRVTGNGGHMGESVENLDEISTKTLDSYAEKAREEAKDLLNKGLRQTKSNRTTVLGRALYNLRKATKRSLGASRAETVSRGKKILGIKDSVEEDVLDESKRVKTPDGSWMNLHTGVKYSKETGNDGNDSYMTPDYMATVNAVLYLNAKYKTHKKEYLNAVKKWIKRGGKVNGSNMPLKPDRGLYPEPVPDFLSMNEDILDEGVLPGQVDVSGEEQYEFANGKKPSGKGSWIFSPKKRIDFAKDKVDKDYFQSTADTTYAQAKQQAKKWAAANGWYQIYIQS